MHLFGQEQANKCLETKLTKMLQDVEPPEMHELDMECIYRVPQNIRESNPEAYTPEIVSIGPFHKASDVGKEDNILESMEELKLKYFKGFLNRTQLPMGDFVVKLKGLEGKIRSCYAEPIKYNSDDFLKMILIDACFIIEHFLRRYRCQDWEGKDPLLLKLFMQESIQMDLILLENQLPFFVLEQLYNLAGMNKEFPSFLEITFHYFKGLSYGTVCPIESPKHFTDLFRTSIISSSKFHHGAQEEYGDIKGVYRRDIKRVYCASQLLEVGLEFKVSPNESIIDLTYSNLGVLTMPILNIDADAEIIFRNILAFEYFHLPCTGIINQYLTFLEFLIKTEKDVNVLVDKKIIVNWMDDANKVATMVKNLTSNTFMPRFNLEYFSLCNSLNGFYENPSNKYKALSHEDFNTPWERASIFVAVGLLLLAMIQTLCSVISLFEGTFFSSRHKNLVAGHARGKKHFTGEAGNLMPIMTYLSRPQRILPVDKNCASKRLIRPIGLTRIPDDTYLWRSEIAIADQLAENTFCPDFDLETLSHSNLIFIHIHFQYKCS